MIKLLAALFMVIDHIGYVFFPQNIVFRLFGRLSMPLFAYCIARGYLVSREHGTTKKYFRNISCFAVAAQIPYSLMQVVAEQVSYKLIQVRFNIGVTWLFSLLLLIVLGEDRKKRSRGFLVGMAIMLVAFHRTVDYGLYGIVMPLIMYFYIVKVYQPYKALDFMVLAWAFYVLGQKGSLIQIVSCAALPVLAAAIPVDKRIRLPKWFFYVFYPAHIMILLTIYVVIKI